MKFIHLADLHFGKLLGGISLASSGDQEAWCRHCIEAVEREEPDAVLIAGDVFDRSQPSAEARRLASGFLTELTRRTRVLMVAGNHDSGDNVEYLSGLLREAGLYAAGLVEREMKRVTLRDAYGEVTFWLAPYFFPTRVAEALGVEVRTYTQAARALIEAQGIDTGTRNVLLAHQLVLSGAEEPERGGSETSVGGVGQIDVHAFDDFDYVALGHIHKPQPIGRAAVRYAGAPLCYHFDEAGKEDERNATLGILVVEMGAKGTEPTFRRIPTPPLHPLRNVRGTLEEILQRERNDARRGEYLRVVLSDLVLPAGTRERLDALFAERGSRLVELGRSFERTGTREAQRAQVGERSVQELFFDYAAYQLGDRQLTEQEQALILRAAELLEQTHEEEKDKAAAQLAKEVSA